MYRSILSFLFVLIININVGVSYSNDDTVLTCSDVKDALYKCKYNSICPNKHLFNINQNVAKPCYSEENSLIDCSIENNCGNNISTSTYNSNDYNTDSSYSKKYPDFQICNDIVDSLNNCLNKNECPGNSLSNLSPYIDRPCNEEVKNLNKCSESNNCGTNISTYTYNGSKYNTDSLHSKKYPDFQICNDIVVALDECSQSNECPSNSLLNLSPYIDRPCSDEEHRLKSCSESNNCSKYVTSYSSSSSEYNNDIDSYNYGSEISDNDFDMTTWNKNKLEKLWKIFEFPAERFLRLFKNGYYDEAISRADDMKPMNITKSINNILRSYERVFKKQFGYEDEGWIVDEMHIYTIELRNTSIDFVQSLRDAYTYNDDGHSIGGIIDGAIRGLTSADGITAWWGESSFDKEERAINNAIKVNEDAFIQAYNEFQTKLDDFVVANYNDMLENN